MECPKCRAHNSEDAVCCSLCFHGFKGKPAPSAASQTQSFRPAGGVTVSYYGTVNLSRGAYLILQAGIFIFLISVLSWIHFKTDADMTAVFPPGMADMPPGWTGAKIRTNSLIFFWLAFAWEAAATWYFLSMFAKKERE